MKRYKRKFTVRSKYENEAALFKSKIIRFEEYNTVYPQDKIKNVFFCEFQNKPEGIMCIYWGNCYAKEGDWVDMKGRMKDGNFLVWSMMISKKGENHPM